MVDPEIEHRRREKNKEFRYILKTDLEKSDLTLFLPTPGLRLL